MTAVAALAGTRATPGSTGEARASGLLRDEFMRILVAQLRYQDPMEPMKERDFLAQMAEFTQATQVEQLAESTKAVMGQMDKLLAAQRLQSFLWAGSLIGKTVTVKSGGSYLELAVDAVTLTSDGIALKSGDVSVPLENVESIGGRTGEGNR